MWWQVICVVDNKVIVLNELILIVSSGFFCDFMFCVFFGLKFYGNEVGIFVQVVLKYVSIENGVLNGVLNNVLFCVVFLNFVDNNDKFVDLSQCFFLM